MDGFQYTNGNLDFFPTAEGYVKVLSSSVSSAYKYVFNYVDHLGNVRLSYSDNDLNGAINPATEIIEESNYYPFGLEHKGYNNIVSANANSVASKFKYNGKELNDELGYNVYDYDARHYDPWTGRWLQIDPLADIDHSISMTPYHYAANNPIVFVDPDGQDWFYYKAEGDDDASYHWQEGSEYSHSYSYTDDDGNEQTSTIELQGVSSFLAVDQNDQVFEFGNDGNISYVPGAGKSAYTATGVFSDDDFVNVTSKEAGRKSDVSMAAASAAVINPTNANPLKAIVSGLAGLAMLTTAAIQTSDVNDMTYEFTFEFAKDSSKNERHDSGQGLTESEQAQVDGLEAQLQGAAKKVKNKIKKKIENIRRNAQKRSKGEEHSRTKKGN